MKTYRLVYNPYKVTTALAVVKGDGKQIPLTEESPMAPIFHQRMQKWLEPGGSWRGFFHELTEMSGEKSLRICFAGTEKDFQDLLQARDAYIAHAQSDIRIENMLDQNEQFRASSQFKLMEIQNLLQDAEKKVPATLIGQDILDCLKHALDSNFEIDVTAPVSAGKSTLQNALIGRRLLPTSNEAKTAVLTRTKINNGMTSFQISCRMHNGDMEYPEGPVNQALVNRLNDELDPNDREAKSALRDEIYLEGPSKQFENCNLSLIFVDTPGGNNAMNERHKEVMHKALYAEEKNMILFVFSYITINHENTKEALREAAEAMQAGQNGKMNQDRFLFVCTGCDLIPDNLSGTEKDIRQVLNSCGISSPNLFMVSSLVMELLRTESRNQALAALGETGDIDRLTRKDMNMLDSCIRQLALPECDLYAHATLPYDIKQEWKKQVTALQKRYEELDDIIWKTEQGMNELPQEELVSLRRELCETGKQIATINSGIPGLEYTIREYLNRYAIPMKIEQACNAIRTKAEAADTLAKAYSRWISSAEAAKKAKEEAIAKKKKLEDSKLLTEDRTKLNAIKLDKNAITSKSAGYMQRVDDLSAPKASDGKYMAIGPKEGLWIKKTAADNYLSLVNQSLEFVMSSIIDSMTAYFNMKVVSSCNEIIKDYQDHIKALNDQGAFDLDGLDLTKIIAVDQHISKDMQLDGFDIVLNKEIVGHHQVAKKGFINGLRRFFGRSSGYTQVAEYKNIEYVFTPDIFSDQKTKMLGVYYDWLKGEISGLEARIEQTKQEAARRMETLDSYIQKQLEAYIAKLDDAAVLQKEAEEYKKQNDWMKDFLNTINEMLELQPGSFEKGEEA